MSARPIVRRLAATALCGALACAAPEASPTEQAAIQLSVASYWAARTAANPGPIETICVAYAGGQASAALPSDVPDLVVLGSDGCSEVDGGLRDLEGRLAVSFQVEAPHMRSADAADVELFTSSGSGDLAAYECSVSRVADAWQTTECALVAIT
jgi:hypothetical protein